MSSTGQVEQRGGVDYLQLFENMLAEVKKRAAPDVIVVGHTDRVGLLQDNDRLALRRAEKMRQELKERVERLSNKETPPEKPDQK